MKTILRDIPESALTDEYTKIVELNYKGKTLRAVLESHPSQILITVTFPTVAGYRVLDERELGEFWTNNIISYEETKNATVAVVEAGGWLDAESSFGALVKDGYYGSAHEYLIVGDYECLNIVSGHPTFSVTAP